MSAERRSWELVRGETVSDCDGSPPRSTMEILRRFQCSERRARKIRDENSGCAVLDADTAEVLK